MSTPSREVALARFRRVMTVSMAVKLVALAAFLAIVIAVGVLR